MLCPCYLGLICSIDMCGLNYFILNQLLFFLDPHGCFTQVKVVFELSIMLAIFQQWYFPANNGMMCNVLIKLYEGYSQNLAVLANKLFLKHDFMNYTMWIWWNFLDLTWEIWPWALKRQELLLPFTATYQCSSPEITDCGMCENLVFWTVTVTFINTDLFWSFLRHVQNSR